MQILSQSSPSELFLVRVWAHEDPAGTQTWRGKAQHVVTGECQYFEDWAALIDLLRGRLPQGAAETHDDPQIQAGTPEGRACCPPAAGPCWDTEF